MLPRASQLSKTSGSAGFHLPEEAERAEAILTEHLSQLSLPPGGLLKTTGPFLGYVRIYPQRGRWCEKKKSRKREGNDLTIRGFQTALNWSQSWWYITRFLQNKGRKKKVIFQIQLYAKLLPNMFNINSHSHHAVLFSKHPPTYGRLKN